MSISENHIQKYQALYREHFGKEISRESALDGCVKLLQLMKMVYKPMTSEQLKEVRKRQASLNNID